MTDSHYMKDPSKVFRSFIGYDHRGHEFHRGYEAGIMAMALELITVAKTVESLPYEDELVPEEIVSTIYTLLNGMDLTEHATLWYERTSEWRRPKLVADELVSVQPDTVSPEQLSLLPRPPRDGAGVSPLGAAARLGTLHAQQPTDQSPGLPSSLLALLHGEGVNTKLIESQRPPGEIGHQADD